MKTPKRLLALLLAATLVAGGLPPVAAAETDDFTLFDGIAVSAVYVDSDATGKTEYPQVVRAVGDLQTDMQSVTGATPVVTADAGALAGTPVLVGTVGHSDLIDALAADGKLDVSDVEHRWEAFTIRLVDAPLPNIPRALVIAGSDMRGTIYGVYTLSEKLGVSPWYWWGDVPIERKTSVAWRADQIETTEQPDVRYRGIFINDEENFQEWSKRFENSTDSPGSPNAKTYEKVFELLLRLKANVLWPAMHQQSTAFNAKLNPETGVSFNAEAADRYGIVMGASHCEMLLRNSETEWEPWCEANKDKYHIEKVNGNWKDGYDYTVNPEAMNAYWEERVASNYRFENVYTIGLRAVHDAAINCKNLADKSDKGKATVVKQAVEAQVAILQKYEQKYKAETGEEKTFTKIFCPYKEAASYFRYDLGLPSDTLIVWADDNHGYVREQLTEEQAAQYAGAGVYYHVSYYDADRPQSYLWVASTPLALIYEEMRKSYDAGADDFWILNVGDLKPAEIPMEFFLTMGWDADRYDDTTIDRFVKSVSARDYGFDEAQGAELADILNGYYQTSIAKRPEYHLAGMGTEYSLIDYGDEAERQIDRLQALCDRSEALYETLPADKKDAYWQMVQYMLRASLFSFQKGVYQQKNQLYAAQDRFGSVNAYAQMAQDAYQRILDDLKTYNTVISGGKWNKIMDPYTTKQGLPTIVGAPSPLTVVGADVAADGIGSVCEGQTYGTEAVTLDFDTLSRDARFIDVFNKGLTPCEWTLRTPDYLTVTGADGVPLTGETEDGETVYTGTVDVETRLWLSLDADKTPSGLTRATVEVSDRFGFAKRYDLRVENAGLSPDADKIGYYETNGEVSIEAEHYSKSVKVGEQEWRVVKGLGRSGDSMKVFPDTVRSAARIDRDFETTAPYLEYNIYFQNAGSYQGTFYRIPVLNEGDDSKTCRTAIQFDDGEIGLLRGYSKVDSGDAWHQGVRNQIERMTLPISIEVSAPGWHTLRVYKSDAGMAFDKITLQNTAFPVRASHLGAPESVNTVAETTLPVVRSTPPEIRSEDLSFPATEEKTRFLYDFTADSANASAGYMGVDNHLQSSTLKRYAWDAASLAHVQAARRTAEKASVRDNGFVYGAEPAAITFSLPRAGTYLVGAAVGDRQAGGVAVRDMRLTANGQTAIEGLNVPAGQTVERGFLVEVGEDHALTVQLSGAWALSGLEIGLYTPPAQNDGSQAFYADSTGTINIEAEAALEQSAFAYRTASTDGQNAAWSETYGESGSAMFTGPNRDGSYTQTSVSAHRGPKLYYTVDVDRTGRYNLWALVKSQCADDDSFLFSMDDKAATAVNDFKDTAGAFRWVRAGSLNVTQTGAHTVSIWAREDGLVVDKLLLTTATTTPTGTGGASLRRANKTALSAEIQAAKAVTGRYTAATYAAFTKALAAATAVEADGTATQSAVDAATATLRESRAALVVDTTPDKPSTPVPPQTPKNGTANVGGKTVLYKNGKPVTGTTLATVGKVTYAVKKGVVQKASKKASYKLVKLGKKSYIVNTKGAVQKSKSAKTGKLFKVGKKRYIVNKKGVVQTAKKKYLLVKAGKRKYIVNRKGVVQVNKKKIKVGKATYKTGKTGIAKKR